MTSRRIAIGFFGIPGFPSSRSSLVHIVAGGQPVCGSKLRPPMEFQWCSWGNLGYVECERCRKTKFARDMREYQRSEANVILRGRG